MSSLYRRNFLKSLGATGLGAVASPLLNLMACGQVAAQTAGDFRALVCVVLGGGNDAFNTVLPTDADSWGHYAATRNQAPDSIALSAIGVAPNPASASSLGKIGGVLPVVPRGKASVSPFAVHPSLAGVRGLFASGRLAVVANVGSLVEPITKDQFFSGSGKRPLRLFSHNDQLNWWQSMSAEGAVQGWAGVMAEAYNNGVSQPHPWLSTVSIDSRWLLGATPTMPSYVVAPAGVAAIPASMFGSATLGTTLAKVSSSTASANLFAKDVAAVARRSTDYTGVLADALPAPDTAPFGEKKKSLYYQSIDPLLANINPLTNVAEFNSLAAQLQMAARTIVAAKKLGLKRQVITVSLGGFDTHDEQNETQTALLAKLDHALVYFDGVLKALNLSNQVTTFTISDFGRTFTSNGDGTDHGWGSHHFVMGGAVNGGRLYGKLPILAKRESGGVFNSPDLIHNGIMLPSLAVDQYGATLGRWFGADDATLKKAFPYLGNFAVQNLGFMAA